MLFDKRWCRPFFDRCFLLQILQIGMIQTDFLPYPVIVTEYLDFSCVVCHVSEAVSMIKAWHLMNSCIHLWHRPFAFVCYPVINRTHIGRHNTDSCHDCISSEVRRILWKYNIKIIQSMIVFCIVNKSFHIVHTQF